MKTRKKSAVESHSNDVNMRQPLTSKLEANRTSSNVLKPNLRTALRAKDRNTDAIRLKRCSVVLCRMNVQAICNETTKKSTPKTKKSPMGQTPSGGQDKENGNVYEYNSFSESATESNNVNKDEMKEYFRKLHAEKKIILKGRKRIGGAPDRKPPTKAAARNKRVKPVNPVKKTVEIASIVQTKSTVPLSKANVASGAIPKVPLKETINVPLENGGKSPANPFRLRTCSIKLRDVTKKQSKPPENIAKAASNSKRNKNAKEKENVPQQEATSQNKNDKVEQFGINKRVSVRLSRKLPNFDENVPAQEQSTKALSSTKAVPSTKLLPSTPVTSTNTKASKKLTVSLTKMDFSGVTKRKKPLPPVDQSTPLMKKNRPADKIALGTLRPPSIQSFINDISSVYDNPVASTSRDDPPISFRISFNNGGSPKKRAARSDSAVRIELDSVSELETSIDTCDLNSDKGDLIIDMDRSDVATPPPPSDSHVMVTTAIVHNSVDEWIENIENEPAADISRLPGLRRTHNASAFVDDNIISPFSESYPAKKRDYGRSPLKSITNNCHSIRSNVSSMFSPQASPFRTKPAFTPSQTATSISLFASDQSGSVRVNIPIIRRSSCNIDQNTSPVRHLSGREINDNVTKGLQIVRGRQISIASANSSNDSTAADGLFGFDCNSDSESEIERHKSNLERIKREALTQKKSALKTIQKEVEKCPLILKPAFTKKSPVKRSVKDEQHHITKKPKDVSNIFGPHKQTQMDIRSVFEAKAVKNAATAGTSNDPGNRDPSPLIFRDIEPEHHRRSYSGPRQYRKRHIDFSDDSSDAADDEESDHGPKKKKKAPIKRKKLIDTQEGRDKEALDRFANELNAEFASIDTYEMPKERS